MRHQHEVPIFLLVLCTVVLGSVLVVHAADAEKGKQLYTQICATCHGQSGKGDGLAAANLPVKPRDHTDKEYMSALSDEHIFKVIKEGGASVGKSPLMVGGMIKDDDQIRDVIAYIRTLCCK